MKSRNKVQLLTAQAQIWPQNWLKIFPCTSKYIFDFITASAPRKLISCKPIVIPKTFESGYFFLERLKISVLIFLAKPFPLNFGAYADLFQICV